ncbi:hypothetical protein QD47_16010 [Paenibacillus terrae]|uniref:Uncharacterized protein n=1 Tax=Paenibacillus terrae TaxID=159743 RepID=A0A0D7WZJ2_9BACL|nr:hypothetical protein QD47_16010 [Paenibacillus terrae]
MFGGFLWLFYDKSAQSHIVVVTLTLLIAVEEALELKLITSMTTVVPTIKLVFMIHHNSMLLGLLYG